MGQPYKPHLSENLKIVDPIWCRIRQEAEAALDRDPLLTTFLSTTILHQSTLEDAVIHRICQRLDHPDIRADLLEQTFQAMLEDWPEWGAILRVDIQAVVDRDAACDRLIDPLLYFKGFHAIQTHRLAHWLWNRGREDFALYLQSLSSEVFQTDIAPAAQMGKGIFLDHATGLVVGKTATIGDNVSILQNVTLGGTGKETETDIPRSGWRASGRRCQGSRQSRDRPLFARCCRFGGVENGAAQQDSGGRAGPYRRGSGMRSAVACHGSAYRLKSTTHSRLSCVFCGSRRAGAYAGFTAVQMACEKRMNGPQRRIGEPFETG